MKQFQVVGLGEVLWDVLPGDNKQLGGAPANFAHVAARLGDAGVVASRVGDDADGAAAIQRLQTVGVDASRLQIDRTNSTGTVKVELENNQPRYLIAKNAAWDFLKFGDDWRALAAGCDAVCFGTLAQRNTVSRRAIKQFLASTTLTALRVFDINLRQKFYTKQIVFGSLKAANVVKLNHEELPILAEMLGGGLRHQTDFLRNLRQSFDLKLVCLTRGAAGSLLIAETQVSEHAGVKIAVKDTIGAGDAFTATVVHGLLRNWDLDEINERANLVAAFVASQNGAMPAFPDQNSWEAQS